MKASTPNQNIDQHGKVKFINHDKNFGFIESNSFGDLFFSAKSAQGGTLKKGDEVFFKLSASRKYPDQVEATMLRKLYRSKDGYLIVNRLNNHLHSGIDEILQEITGQIECNGRSFIQEEIKFDREVGKCILVEVDESDEIVYAIRKGRSGHTKFVIGREPELCKSVAIILKKIESGYIIVTSFIGRLSVPEPWDEKATAKSLEFWKSHALIYGHEEIIDESVTKICPWTHCHPVTKILEPRDNKVNELIGLI